MFRVTAISFGAALILSSFSFLASVSFGQSVPPNDDFASATVMVGTSNVVTGSNAGATSEPGEPPHDGNPAARSVWWSWSPPATHSVSISTAGSSFDTVLAVYLQST